MVKTALSVIRKRNVKSFRRIEDLMFANDFLTCQLGKKRFKTRFCHRKTQNTYPRTLPIVTATRVNAQNKLTAVSWRFRQLTQISIITTKHSGIACKYFIAINT